MAAAVSANGSANPDFMGFQQVTVNYLVLYSTYWALVVLMTADYVFCDAIDRDGYQLLPDTRYLLPECGLLTLDCFLALLVLVGVWEEGVTATPK